MLVMRCLVLAGHELLSSPSYRRVRSVFCLPVAKAGNRLFRGRLFLLHLTEEIRYCAVENVLSTNGIVPSLQHSAALVAC